MFDFIKDKCIKYAELEDKEWQINPWTFWAKGTFYQRLRLKEIAEESLKIHNGDILEIGAGIGEQTVRFLELARQYNRKLIVIDPWAPGQQNFMGGNDFEIFNFLIRNYKPHIMIIRDSSLNENVINFIKQNNFAFSFVDGLHQYEPCKTDISTVINNSKIIAVDDLLQLEECRTAFNASANDHTKYWNESLNEGYIII